MPAFGNDGIKNLNQQKETPVWEIVNPEGKVLMVCNTEAQANEHRTSLSQKCNKELTVRPGKLRCL